MNVGIVKNLKKNPAQFFVMIIFASKPIKSSPLVTHGTKFHLNKRALYSFTAENIYPLKQS